MSTENTSTIDSDVSSALADLGVDESILNEGQETEVEADDTEVEGETEQSESTDATDEEEGETEVATESTEEEDTEAPKEEPKLTLKEFQEIQAEREKLDAERKSFQEEKQSMEKEFHAKYSQKASSFDELDAFLEHLAEKDPDVFGIMQAEFKEFGKQYSNPAVSKLENELKGLRDELNSFRSKASDDVTLTKLDSEFEKFNSTLGKEAEAAGLKVDRKAIEVLWEKGLTVNEAFYAKYGEAFAKASASKAKVAAVEKKIQGRPAVKTSGTANKAKLPEGSDKRPNEDWVEYYARKLGA